MSDRTTKLKYAARLIAGGTPEVADEQNWAQGDDGLAWVSIGDMSNRSRVVQTSRRVTRSGVLAARLEVVPAGTLLMSMYASLGHTAFTSELSAWNQAILAIVPREGFNSSFIGHVLSSQRVSLEGLARSSTQSNLNAEQVGNLRIPDVSLAEQQGIANFLDVEVARIEDVHLARRRSLALLRERLVCELDALVRGVNLDPGERADFEPLDLVPRGWRFGRLRSVECDVQTGPFGSQLHAEDYIEDGWPVINPANISSFGLVADNSVTVSEEVRSRLSRHVLRSGDVIFARRGEIGRAALVEEAQEGWICGTGSLRVRFAGDFHSGYLRRYLGIPAVRYYFERSSVGSTMPNLNSSILLDMPLLMPEFKDQEGISRRCDFIEAEYFRLIEKVECQLDVLKERKRALITAAVTGQIDVTTARGADLS